MYKLVDKSVMIGPNIPKYEDLFSTDFEKLLIIDDGENSVTKVS